MSSLMRLWQILAATIIAAGIAQPASAAAAEPSCAADSLSRNEIARAQAAARSSLATTARLTLSFACWNPDIAHVGFETPKQQTPDGVQQWWSVACERDESKWECKPPEFNQFILTKLAVGAQSQAVELKFGRGIELARARFLSSRALSMYADPATQLRDCGTIDDGVTGTIGTRRNDKPLSAHEPFHVNVIRDAAVDSVWLNDVDVIIAFDAAGRERSPCWEDVVIVN